MKTPISEIKPGRIVSYHGHSCIVLEHRNDGTFIIPVKPTIHEFGTKNNFALSQLAEHLNNSFLHYITDNHPDEIIHRNVDLTAINGSRQYSSIDCQIAPLTLDELRKYHGILPKPNATEWTATPWSTPYVNNDSTHVLAWCSNGDIIASNIYNRLQVRPGFLIQSTCPIYYEANTLEKYSTDELIAEIKRRENA